MSAASSGYDPVGVEALDPANLERDVQEALASVTAATDLAGLADARRRHLGDRSPLALANREIGALPPAARAEAGQRVGAARSRIRAVLESRGAQLEVEAAEHILVTEVVDVTLPWQRRHPGARHPLTTLAERIGDIFVAMGF
ncbi:MAG: phenylalanine--tRNA ligase subunit alpha, partial [Actinomycetes bacterium]